MRAVVGAFLLLAGVAHAAPNVLNNSAHAATNIAPAVTAVLGAGHVDVDIFIDETDTGSTFVGNMVGLATNTVRSNVRVAGGAPSNKAPYGVVTTSFSSYTLSVDTDNYAAAIAGNIVNNWAYAPIATLPASTPPPVSAVAVLDQANPSGAGIEFGVSTSYKGLNTASPSNTAALMAGFLAAMRFQHPTWTWADIKGALRQTAGNWATGYDHAAFGYGFIDYDSATAVASTSAIFLQPPVMTVTATGSQLGITLYAFRQTRRVSEAVYLVPASYSFPLKNEYTTSDITASGGLLIYSSNGTDIISSGTVNLTPGQFSGSYAGSWNVVAFTSDGSGGFSRVEPFSLIGLTIAGSCS